ncbi:hypothetical protein EXIGLDRAFT_733631 [Exidia glandulosa HHB12029]|uniref:Uncharacterized protein n=1 Tax=Exidia glandulosa HHB12029 TaxID=1314781 RepID=A0A165KFZ8_EXIGL|nr:hypothetical protein EXIGLDRAFT_733631 [Exidia glandulosa HHB12029]
MSLVNTTVVKLPHGEYLTSGHYKPGDSEGVVALAIAAGMSCVSVTTLLILLIISATRTFQAPGQVVFIKTHVAAYFVSLLFCDFWQSIGSLLSIRWVAEMGVTTGVSCTAQAAIKNGGNVGTAIWSLVIAMHTFLVLFCGMRPYEPVLYVTLIVVWTLIGLIVVIGPGIVENAARGPYFGISGLWCWITDAYPMQQLLLEYIWMFASAFFSLLLYILVWLKLRGNIVISGRRWKIRRATARTRWDPQTGQGSLEAQVTGITRQMMLYPIAYFIIILPMAACRYANWADDVVPFQAIIFADVIFLLQGFINTVLFFSTRNVIPADHRNIFRIERDEDMEEKGEKVPSHHSKPKKVKPLKIQQAIGVISIEPARAPSPRPAPRVIHAVRPSHTRGLSREELSKVNANYAPVPPPSPPPKAWPSRARKPLKVVNHSNTRWDEDSQWAGVSLLERTPEPRYNHVRNDSRAGSEGSVVSYASEDSRTPLTAGIQTPRSSAPLMLDTFGQVDLPPTVTICSASTASPVSQPRRAPSALALEAATRRPPPTSVPNTARPPTPASAMTGLRRSHSYTSSNDHSRQSHSDSETQHVFLDGRTYI